MITDSEMAVLQDSKTFFLEKEKLLVRFNLVKGDQIKNQDNQNTEILDR